MTTLPHTSNRRYFLKAAGVTLALPLLESLTDRAFGPPLALASEPGAKVEGQRPLRIMAIGNALGFFGPAFFPTGTGRTYEFPQLLKPLEPHRNDFTLFSGLDHGVKGGHFAIHAFLSGVRTVDAKGMPEGNISLDQRAAEAIGGVTRFPSLAVGSQDGIHGGCMMCWTRSGTRVPPIQGPKELFHKLFINDNEADRARAEDRILLQSSILDAVQGDARSLSRRLAKRDQQKLEEYFTSVRDVERQLVLHRQWANIPKPTPEMPEPINNGLAADLPALYDLLVLALQTDSTRIATLEIADGFDVTSFGLRAGYHALSHHGQRQESIDGLLKLEIYQMEQFARFLDKLKSIDDGDGTLLDHTMVLFGSGMGNANAHTNNNLPIILAGGGFDHGEHKAYPQSGIGRQPLCNLFVTMLQRFGLEIDRFGTSTGTLTGLA